MEEVNGSTVIARSESAEPTYFGPSDTGGAYVAIIGIFPPGEPAPPFHIHPNTDEAFYVAEGEATFVLGTAGVLPSGRPRRRENRKHAETAR